MSPFFTPAGSNNTDFTSDDKGLFASDTLNGISQKNARMWQIIALVSLSSFFIALGILAYAINLPKTVPVIVTVSPTGEANYAGKVDSALYSKSAIPEIAKIFQINRLLSRMHTWVIDKEAQQTYIKEAMSLVQGGGIRQLDNFYRANNPYTNFGEKTRSIEIEPPLRQSEKTYIIYFTTTEKNLNGYAGKVQRWSALMNIELYEASPENPLGLYITNFDIKLIEAKK